MAFCQKNQISKVNKRESMNQFDDLVILPPDLPRLPLFCGLSASKGNR